MIGLGVYDCLARDLVDPDTGEQYPALSCYNDQTMADRCTVANAPRVIWSIKASAQMNNDCAVLLREGFRSGRLRLLINEYERLGDHAVKIFDVMSGLHDQGSSFTEEAQKDMDRILTALTDCYAEAFRCDIEGDAEGAGALLPLKQVIGKFCEILRDRHSRRLAEGICSAEQGLAFNDILTYIESIASHSINIATAVVRYSPGKFNSSEYMHNLNTISQRSYQERYDAFVKKYISSEF